jgi:hypothetical protein
MELSEFHGRGEKGKLLGGAGRESTCQLWGWAVCGFSVSPFLGSIFFFLFFA